MLSFFKKNKNEKLTKQGLDSTVSTQELLNVEEETGNENEVFTELSLHPMMNITTEQSYVLRFLNNELPPLKPNQISLAGIEINREEEQIIVSAFVRNSLSKGVTFSQTTLLLLGANDKLIARKEFDLSELGEIPAQSSRPWNFVFGPKDLLSNEPIPKTDWKLAFQLKTTQEHRLDLDKEWEQSLSESGKEKLVNLVRNISPPKEGEINFMGIQAKKNEQGDLVVTLLIRNGSDKDVQLEQLPLQVEDSEKDIVAKGAFTLNNLIVKANTSKPWTFIFPKSMVIKDNPNFSRWKVLPINQ
ncbi:accessory Sec system S-layer assembly protein [Bacillus sp. 7504-2]|nr:accessory Sec system S-layer assembly protein [Bacillus sp. 7504-2]